MHPLLAQQIKRFPLRESEAPWLAGFLDIIDESYRASDAQRQQFERSMEIVSDELTERNGQLRQRHEQLESTHAELLATNNDLKRLTDELELRVAERTAALGLAQEKYRSMFENATDGIFQTTEDGRYLACNPALAKIYGYASPDDL